MSPGPVDFGMHADASAGLAGGGGRGWGMRPDLGRAEAAREAEKQQRGTSRGVVAARIQRVALRRAACSGGEG